MAIRRRGWLLAGLALLALTQAGCAQAGPAGSAGAPVDPGATAEPRQQAFTPPYGTAPAAGRLTRIDQAALSADKRQLAVGFVGGPGYAYADPCSNRYVPWVAATGDELDVAIVEVDSPHAAWPAGPSGVHYACALVGYGWQYTLGLAAAFEGNDINDRAGGTFYITNPDRLAVATDPPAGWSLRQSFEQEPGPPAIWVEIYAPSPIPTAPPQEGAGQLVLYQALGIIGEWSDTRGEKSRERGGTATDVAINGQATKLWSDPSTCELLVAWTLEGRSLGLVGNSADMTAKDLVRYAEGVQIRP